MFLRYQATKNAFVIIITIEVLLLEIIHFENKHQKPTGC